MNDRISIKGRGAELFFGDEERSEAPALPNPELPEVPATHAAAEPASPAAAPPPSQQATLPASAQATKDAITQPNDIDASTQSSGIDAATRHRLRELLAQNHPLHYSYRFTREEIDALRDIVYELEVNSGLRITRNDVVRLGLDWVIDDYRAHGKESLLMQVMKEEKWSPER